jgi:hypothetical protein
MLPFRQKSLEAAYHLRNINFISDSLETVAVFTYFRTVVLTCQLNEVARDDGGTAEARGALGAASGAAHGAHG